MSIDSLAMVSPDFYEQFFQPVLEQICRENGTLTVHSCGDFRQVLPGLSRTRGIRAVNASQLSISELYDAGLSKDILSILMTDRKDLAELVRTANRCGCRFDVSVTGVHEAVFSGDAPLPEFWRPEHIRKWKEEDARIREQLSEFRSAGGGQKEAPEQN